MNLGKKIGCAWGVLLLLTIVISNNNTKMSADLITILFIAAGFIATITLCVLDIKAFAKPENQPKVSLSVKKNIQTQQRIGFTLSVYECSNANRRVLKVAKNLNYDYTFHPEKTVFTAATVGGITTGGFHTEKAHHTYNVSQSDKCSLTYTGSCIEAVLYEKQNPPYTITDIVLTTSDLVKKAKNNPVVSKYLEGNKLVLRRMSRDTAEQIKTSFNTKDSTLQMNVLAKATTDMGISKSDADAILNWLCQG